MSNSINRSDVLDALLTGKEFLMRVLDDMDVVGPTREKYSWGVELIESFIDDVEELPSAEPQKKGKWIVTSEFEDCCYVKCDQCKVTQVFYYNKPLTNFCPNCGCDMRGDGNDEVNL